LDGRGRKRKEKEAALYILSGVNRGKTRVERGGEGRGGGGRRWRGGGKTGGRGLGCSAEQEGGSQYLIRETKKGKGGGDLHLLSQEKKSNVFFHEKERGKSSQGEGKTNFSLLRIKSSQEERSPYRPRRKEKNTRRSSSHWNRGKKKTFLKKKSAKKKRKRKLQFPIKVRFPKRLGKRKGKTQALFCELKVRAGGKGGGKGELRGDAPFVARR